MNQTTHLGNVVPQGEKQPVKGATVFVGVARLPISARFWLLQREVRAQYQFIQLLLGQSSRSWHQRQDPATERRALRQAEQHVSRSDTITCKTGYLIAVFNVGDAQKVRLAFCSEGISVRQFLQSDDPCFFTLEVLHLRCSSRTPWFRERNSNQQT